MARVADIIEVAKRGGFPAERLANAGDPDKDLKSTSWLVHQLMLEEAQKQGASELTGAEDGAVWYSWHGTLSNLLVILQLATREDELQLRAVRRNVSYWLRNMGNAACIHRTNGSPNADSSKETIWAVRAVFREVPAPADLPVFSMITTAAPTRQVPDDVIRPAASVAERPAPAHRGNNIRGANGAGERLSCPHCGRDTDRVYIARHVFHDHVNPLPIVLEAIRTSRGGRMLSTEITAALSDMAGGGAVSTSFVANLLKKSIDAGVIYTKKEWGGLFWYVWLGNAQLVANPQRTQSPPPLAAAAAAAEVRESISADGEAEAAIREPAAVLVRPPTAVDWGAAQEPDAPLRAEIAPAPQEPEQRAQRVMTITELGAGAELSAALEALEAAMRTVHRAARKALEENADLRKYRDRVRTLLGQVEQ